MCVLLIETVTSLPEWNSNSLTHLLRRDRQILGQLNDILHKLPRIDEAPPSEEAFDQAYRKMVVARLDQTTLHGTSLPDEARIQPLTSTYVVLDVAVGGQRQPVDWVLSDHARILVRGEAGSGKTTLLRWIAVMAAKRSLAGLLTRWNDFLPCYIPVRQLTAGALPPPGGLFRFIAPEFSEDRVLNHVERQLAEGQVVVLVDGMDEVREADRGRVRTWLHELTTAYPGARYIVTTRPGAVPRDWLGTSGFTCADVMPLDDQAVATLIRQWFAAVAPFDDVVTEVDEQRWPHRLLEQVHASPQLAELATNPLMCALMCALAQSRRGQLPHYRTDLYDLFVEVLVERRDVARRVVDSYALGRRQSLVLLEDLAYWLQRNGRTEIAPDRAVDRIENSLRQMSVAPAAEQAYRLLLERSGILREIAPDAVQFTHRTFQEYFAARAAVANDDVEYLVSRVDEASWQNVALLAAGCASTRQVDHLLSLLLTRARDDENALELAKQCLAAAPVVSPELRKEVEQAVRRSPDRAD